MYLYHLIPFWAWLIIAAIAFVITILISANNYVKKHRAITSVPTPRANVAVAHANTVNYYDGNGSTNKLPKDIKSEASIDVSIEPPLFPMNGPNVIRFTVTNKNKIKLVNCHAKIEVIGVYSNSEGALTLNLHPANYMYPNNVLWGTISKEGNVDLLPGEPNYLDVIELGQKHFRFLFDGDAPLKAGALEPNDADKNVWLSHKYHLLSIKLFGEDIHQNPLEIKKEFALTLMVGGNQSVVFDSNGKPSIDNTKPDAVCIMIVREIKSHDNIRIYFGMRPGELLH